MRPPTYEPLQKSLLVAEQEEYWGINARLCLSSEPSQNIEGFTPRWILLFHILNTSSNTFPVQEVESWPSACE